MKIDTSTALLLAGALALPMLAAAQEPVLEEIVVTGSRVIKNGDSSPTPVTVVATEDVLKVQPGSLADALNVMPVFSGSRGSGSNPTATGSVAAGNASANQLNLRNLGTSRNLVLLDGLRIPPTLINGSVDVDLIPQMLVERVDTVTGGVSAVYGSDAISGVVNYIINKKFNGIKALASYGISEQSDAEKYNAGFAVGSDVGARGHFEASYEYRREEGILYRSDRDWMRQWGVTGQGTANNPYELVGNIRLPATPFGGRITSVTAPAGTPALPANPYAGQFFRNNGQLSAFNNGAATRSATLQAGGDGGYWDSSLLQPMEGHQLFGRYDLDITDDLHWHAQIGGNIKTNEAEAEYFLLNNVRIGTDNAFLDPALRTQMNNAGTPGFLLSGLYPSFPRFKAESESKQWIYMTGLNGALGEYDWGIDAVHGRTKLGTTLPYNINAQKLYYALDSILVGGQPVCRINTTSASLGQGCQPLNVFGPSAANAAAMDYVLDPTDFNGETVMTDFSAYISGAPFNTWAGPINMALSGEWREQSFEGHSTGRPTEVLSCAAMGFVGGGTQYNVGRNCVEGAPLWTQSFAEAPEVSQKVWETALEFDAPILANLPAVQALNFNAAGRFTNYNTSGDYWTWKAGLDWQIVDSLRFRATRSRDIRAPSLSDLFAPENFVYVANNDLLTNTSPRVQSIDLSNSTLTAEISNAVTAGIVWKPTADLSIALDGYRIIVSDALASVNGSQPDIQRACYAGDAFSCTLQRRDANGVVTAWYQTSLNLAEIETYGVDLEINYATELFNRPLNLRFMGAYQPHILYRQPPAETRDQGGVAFGPLGAAASPAVRLTGLLRFQPTDNLTLDLMQRWRSHMKLGGIPSEVWVYNHVDSFATTTINVAYDLDTSFGNLQVFLNVQNLFDADPPGGAFSGNGARSGLRDGYPVGDSPLGRYYTVGVIFKM